MAEVWLLLVIALMLHALRGVVDDGDHHAINTAIDALLCSLAGPQSPLPSLFLPLPADPRMLLAAALLAVQQA